MVTQNPYFRVRAEVQDSEGLFVVEFSMSGLDFTETDKSDEEVVEQRIQERFDFEFRSLLSVEH
jgi:hypothetical protein